MKRQITINNLDINLKTDKWLAVRVINNNLPRFRFNKLCDTLSRLRRCCLDYRMIDGHETMPNGKIFWQSTSYDATDTYMVRVAEESVTDDVKKFLKQNNLSDDSVSIETIKLE